MMFRHKCIHLCPSSISGAHWIPPIHAIIHGLMSFELDGFSKYAECSKGYNIEFGDEVFGAYNQFTGSILTSGGDNIYLNVTYFDSAFAATSGGVFTGCPRVMKRIAVTNDFGKSLLVLGFVSKKPFSGKKKSNCSRSIAVSINELVCRLRTTFKITCCCFVVVLLG